MIHKKVYKRFLSSLLALTIFFQSFTSMEFPSFAALASASDSLEAYIDESNYEEVEEDSFFNDFEDEVIVDDLGRELVPLSPEQIEILENPKSVEDDPNYLPDSYFQNSKKARIVGIDDAALVFYFAFLLFSVGFYGIKLATVRKQYGYIKTYGYTGHTSTFSPVDFTYSSLLGKLVTKTITQEMVESYAKKVEKFEKLSTYFDVTVDLTEDDKLVIAYFTNLASGTAIDFTALNVRITAPKIKPDHDYPYFLLVATSASTLKMICFDKIPTGAFGCVNSYGSSLTPYYEFYDYEKNLLRSYQSLIFYNKMESFKDTDGNNQVMVDYCNYVVYDYKLNSLTRFFENTNTYVEYYGTEISNGVSSLKGLSSYLGSYDKTKSFLYLSSSLPFNVFYSDSVSYPSVYEIYKLSLMTPDLDSRVDGYSIVNTPRVFNRGVFVNSLPDQLTTKEEFDIDNYKNLYGTYTVLNPAIGVFNGDVAETVAPPTVAPSESASVSPSNPDIGGGDVTGSLSNILAKIGEFFNWAKTSLSPTAFATAVATALGLNLLFQSISVPLNNMFEWVKTNISPASFATAVATALCLSALFDTVVIPLSQILSKVNLISTISSTLNDIARWDIETWIGVFADPLAHLLSIDDVLTNISDWDIDVSIGGLATTLTGISADIRDLALSIPKWTFADWTAAMSQALKDIIEKPLVGIKSVADAIDLALDNVASWDLAKALDALQKAVVNALTGTLTIAGIASLIEILTNIKDAIKELTSGKDLENPDSDSDSGFLSLAKLLYLLLLIIILLIIIFINCLRFIVSIFSIPTSTALLNADVLKGIDFVKSLRLERFNLSLYDLIVVIVNFLLFVSIIKALKRKIDTLRL